MYRLPPSSTSLQTTSRTSSSPIGWKSRERMLTPSIRLAPSAARWAAHRFDWIYVLLILLCSSLCWKTTSCLTSWMTSAKRTSAASVYGTDSLTKGRLKSSEKWSQSHFSSFPFRGGVLCRIWRAIQRHRERQRTTECAGDRVWLESGAGSADRILKQVSLQLNYNLKTPQGLQQLIVQFYHPSAFIHFPIHRDQNKPTKSWC